MLSYKRILFVFACIALFSAPADAADDDTTYNSDAENTAGAGSGVGTATRDPQYQTPRNKKYKGIQIKNYGHTRYPGGDYVQVELCCEHGAPGDCISYGNLYSADGAHTELGSGTITKVEKD